MKDMDFKGLLIIIIFAAIITVLFLFNLKRIENNIDNDKQIEEIKEIDNMYNELEK